MTYDWNRWHDLLDIRDGRGFTDSEQAEYETFLPEVARMDAEESAVCRPAMEALMKRHHRVLDSIRRLTAALGKANA